MKYAICIMAVILSTPTFASRVVSATGGGRPMGHDRASACQNAKDKAAEKAHGDEEVKAFTQCECTKANDDDDPWTCTVNATVGKKE